MKVRKRVKKGYVQGKKKRMKTDKLMLKLDLYEKRKKRKRKNK